MILPLYNDFRADADELQERPELVEQFEGIQRCRESRGVEICSACLFYDDCDRIKTYFRWVEQYKQSGKKSEG